MKNFVFNKYLVSKGSFKLYDFLNKKENVEVFNINFSENAYKIQKKYIRTDSDNVCFDLVCSYKDTDSPEQRFSNAVEIDYGCLALYSDDQFIAKVYIDDGIYPIFILYKNNLPVGFRIEFKDDIINPYATYKINENYLPNQINIESRPYYNVDRIINDAKKKSINDTQIDLLKDFIKNEFYKGNYKDVIKLYELISSHMTKADKMKFDYSLKQIELNRFSS